MYNKNYTKKLRKRLKWTVEQLAEFCRVSKGNVYNWECGLRKPSGSALKLMENVDKLMEV